MHSITVPKVTGTSNKAAERHVTDPSGLKAASPNLVEEL